MPNTRPCHGTSSTTGLDAKQRMASAKAFWAVKILGRQGPARHHHKHGLLTSKIHHLVVTNSSDTKGKTAKHCVQISSTQWVASSIASFNWPPVQPVSTTLQSYAKLIFHKVCTFNCIHHTTTAFTVATTSRQQNLQEPR